MHFFTFAEKYTTLYQDSGSLNAGLDEVLEIRKDVSDTGDVVDVSRILIQFDLTKISQSIYSLNEKPDSGKSPNFLSLTIALNSIKLGLNNRTPLYTS